jgi:hypothetical protein
LRAKLANSIRFQSKEGGQDGWIRQWEDEINHIGKIFCDVAEI